MIKDLLLPDLGEGIEGAEVSEVSVSVGDKVSPDDIVLVLESDKASMEIPAETQLAFIDFEKGSKQWVVSLLNRAIVLDKRGVIIDGFGNFSSPEFSNLLRKY